MKVICTKAPLSSTGEVMDANDDITTWAVGGHSLGGVAASSVGILAWKSALEDGRPFEMPDFRNEADRAQWQDDTFSPFPSHIKAGCMPLPPSVLGTPEPTKKGVANARRVWREIGYGGR